MASRQGTLAMPVAYPKTAGMLSPDGEFDETQFAIAQVTEGACRENPREKSTTY